VHVAIIMDGNRRWAKARGLSSVDGHRQGVAALMKTVEAAVKLGIKFLTVFALSTENFQNRSKREIAAIFRLIEEGFKQHLPRLKKAGIKLICLGDLDPLPIATQVLIRQIFKELSDGKKLVLAVAVNYGGREEIVRAVRRIQKEKKEIKEKDISDNLDTAGLPDPDLIIRTGGQARLSNFLLWQSSYSELYFTNTLWPDFSEKELEAALEEYGRRVRNFGR